MCNVMCFRSQIPRSFAVFVIGEADLALRDLFEDRVPLEAVQRHVGDVRALVSKMIEVQNDRIALPAVDTWMSRQVLPHTKLVFGGMLVSQHTTMMDLLLADLHVS